MIRFLLRFLGLLMLAVAFLLVVNDGVKSIADSKFYATSVFYTWTEIHVSSLEAAQAAVERMSGTLWNLAIAPVLNQPAALVFAVLGAVLIVLGRKKKPLIGYARD